MQEQPSNMLPGTGSISYEQVFKAIAAGMAIHKVIRSETGEAVDTEIIDVNPVWERIMGGQRDEVVGRRLSSLEVMEPVSGETLIQVYGRVAATGKSETINAYSSFLNRYFEVTLVSLEDEIVVSAFRDITGSWHSEMTYQSIFNAVHDSIFVYDIETGKIVDLNAKAAEQMGYPREIILGSVQMPHESPEVGKRRILLIRSAAAGQVVKDESIYITPDGKEEWLESCYQVAIVGGEKRVIAIARNISDQKQAQRALKKSEERYRVVSELGSDFAFSMVFTDEGNWDLDWATDAFTRLTGYTVEDLIEADPDPFQSPVFLLEKLIHPDDRWILARHMENLRRERSFECEFRMIRKNGSVIWIRASIKAAVNNRRLTGVTGAVKDITYQVQAENNYRAIFESVNDAILVLDAADGTVLDANHNGDAMLIEGWTEHPDGRMPECLFADLSHEAFIAVVKAAAAGEPQEQEWQLSSPSGRWVNARMTPVVIGGQTRVLAVFRDVTDRQKTMEAIRETEEHYRSVSDRISDWAYLMDIDANGSARFLWTTASLERMTGRSQAEVRSGYAREGLEYAYILVHPDDHHIVRDAIERLKRQEHVLESEFRLLKPDGEIVWVHSYTRAMRGPRGKLTGICGVVQDISARVRAETTFRSIFEAINEGIFVFDPSNGAVVDANLLGCQMLGLNRAEVIGTCPPLHALIKRSLEQWIELLQSVAKGAEREVEVQVEIPQRGLNWLHVWLKRVMIAGEERVLAVLRDITGQKREIDAVILNEKIYRSVANLFAKNSFSFDMIPGGGTWKIKWLSGSIQEILGYDPEAIQARFDESDCLSIAQIVYPEDRQIALKCLEIASLGGETTGDVRLFEKDGALRWVRLKLQGDVACGDNIRVYGCVIDITPWKQKEESLALKVDQLSAINSLQLALSASRDLQVTINSLLPQGLSILQADLVELYLSEVESGELQFAGRCGFRLLPERQRTACGETLAKQAASERRICRFPDVQTDPVLRASRELKQEDVVSAAAVPLIYQGRLVGVMNLYRRSSGFEESGWEEIASLAAVHAAVAIDNARSFEQLQVKGR